MTRSVPGRLHQGENRAVGSGLKELSACVIVGEFLHVALHQVQVLDDFALFGNANAGRGGVGYLG